MRAVTARAGPWVAALSAALAAAFLLATPAAAQTGGGPLAGLACVAPDQRTAAQAVAVGALVSVQGRVRIQRAGIQRIDAGVTDGLICPGDRIEVGERSRAALLLFGADTVLRLDQNTTLQIPAQVVPEEGILALIRGALYFLSRTPRRLTVQTPFVNAGVDGTEFLVRYDEARRLAFVGVFEGVVHARSAREDIRLTAGQAVAVGADGVMRLVVTPPDAVQWAIHYDPIFAFLAGPRTEPAERAVPLALQPSYAAFMRGDPGAAIRLLDSVPEPARDARFHVYHAALLLAVGPQSAAEARAAVDRALALNPDSAEAYAIGSVIALAVNDKAAALTQGHRAVQLAPGSLPARLALSYAQQADFRLQDALDTLLQAPGGENDALFQARIAELQLALGRHDAALAAARRALSIEPRAPRAHMVLGYVLLARLETDEAAQSFASAIELDSAQPLAWLGAGLAEIRHGELARGREQIEIAAALDPNDPIIRSYLGKAYYEEKRNDPAAAQFETAKLLDPHDPTPFFYDALRKQTENRPVEALQDLQKSIALNDNRAVYRSRFQLDQDVSTRSASLARIFDDLGFEQRALFEGWRSVTFDPTNFAAHRLLADTYRALPRHEVARVSELLQSQLRQPLNAAPLQPQLSESNLFILEDAGPSTLSYNEFNPLFTREGMRLQASGIVGSNDTLGNDAVLSLLSGRVAASFGQFHYETDGFRANNDLNEDIYNAFVQVSLTPDTSIQAEVRSREFERGDLALRFDPANFLRNLRQREELDSVRLGLHHVFAPNLDMIANLQVADGEALSRFPGISQVQRQDEGYLGEVQLSYQAESWSVIFGGTAADIDRNEELRLAVFPLPLVDEDIRLKHYNLFAYPQIGLFDDVVLTLGASVDFFDGDERRRNQLNPKLGVLWAITPQTTLRAAAFRTLKRTLVTSQTIEPTHVAGFNQLFDDPEGTDAWRYGIGIDHQLSGPADPPLFVGAELSARELTSPTIFPLPVRSAVTGDNQEQLARAYVYWAPDPQWALDAEYRFERFEREPQSVGPEGILESSTHRLGLGVSFFHPSGLLARMRGSLIRQEGEFTSASGLGTTEGADTFFTLDASLRYRLPDRLGFFSLEARNLLDASFRFQDTDPASPEIFPEAAVFARLNLFF